MGRSPTVLQSSTDRGLREGQDLGDRRLACPGGSPGLNLGGPGVDWYSEGIALGLGLQTWKVGRDVSTDDGGTGESSPSRVDEPANLRPCSGGWLPAGSGRTAQRPFPHDLRMRVHNADDQGDEDRGGPPGDVPPDHRLCGAIARTGERRRVATHSDEGGLGSQLRLEHAPLPRDC